MSKRYKRKREQGWENQEVDLTRLSLEQLGQAFQLLVLPRQPDKLPKELLNINPVEWVALECLLVELLQQKQVQTVH